MENTSYLITNNVFADVNDQIWQSIKDYMKQASGIDLSSSEIDINNNYDGLKNLMNMKNPNDLINNIIFTNINKLFASNDDETILILNLIIYSLIKSYKTLQYDDVINHNNANDNNEDDKRFNLINDDKGAKKISKNKLITNLLINDFFRFDLLNDKTPNIINYLFNYLNMQKKF